MAGLTEFYCGWNEPSHASQFKWLEYTFKNRFNAGSWQYYISNKLPIGHAKIARIKFSKKISLQIKYY
jgi:hypothetical protein